MGQAGPAGGRAAGGREARAQAQRHTMLPLRPCAVAASACSPPAAAWPPAACRSGTCRGMRACTGRSRCSPGGTPAGGGRQGAAGSRQVRQLGPARNLACKLHATPVRAAWQHTHSYASGRKQPTTPAHLDAVLQALERRAAALDGHRVEASGRAAQLLGGGQHGADGGVGAHKGADVALRAVGAVPLGNLRQARVGGVGSGGNGGDSITRQPVQGRWQHIQAELSNPAASRTHTASAPASQKNAPGWRSTASQCRWCRAGRRRRAGTRCGQSSGRAGAGKPLWTRS